MVGRDGIAALVILVASGVLFALTFGLHANPLVPIGPAFYPRIVLGVTAALAVLLLVVDVVAQRRHPAARPEPAAEPLNYRLVLVAFVVFGLYVAALPHLGFRIATLAFVVAFQAVLDPPRTARHWIVVLAIAAATTVVTYFVFERYLSVLLPRGPWTDF